MTPESEPARPDSRTFDVVVVGAGFAGLYMLHRLSARGLKVKVFEAGSDVGGTWFWNRYPGARCDVESLEYSYSFSDELQQEWQWSERFATQPEIHRYITHVAQRFGLKRQVQLNTRVVSAVFDDAANRWTVTTEHGDAVEAPFCIMATGCLSAAKIPQLPGLDSFKGPIYHTGQWPSGPIDFSGQRVGVVGTGSSGIQMIPQLAKQAKRLYVFQRTASYSLPARNAPLDPQYERETKSGYTQLRKQARESPTGVAGFPVPDKSIFDVTPEERERIFNQRWEAGGIGFTRAFKDVLLDKKANQVAADFVRGKIRALVHDPKVADLLTPAYLIGTKRLCADTEYFQTYNRDNVTLVDIKRSPIQEITAQGIRTEDASYELDAIAFATGFDAMTGALLGVDIRSTSGVSLRERWTQGPRTYLGLMVAGLPNLFMITGPGSPSVLSNVIVSIEQHVEWISECLQYLGANGLKRIEAESQAQDDWVAHVNALADGTLMPQGASWYVGANIPGKPRVFMPYVGGVGAYRKKCSEVAQGGYTGFRLSQGDGSGSGSTGS